ncbi:hypothetical protein F183_A08460 [Bryobacterales bacterium F-183]|nr:hypothetical protein F183_A08460 [Bryobacterales bacterium F-183]
MYHVAIRMLRVFLLFLLVFSAFAADRRVLLDAHNCYPYAGLFDDRIDRALATGIPIAIEQDLAWHVDHSVLSHEVKTTGTEPLMQKYFFEKIRPIVEKELKDGDKKKWPIITLNLDFKTNEPEHHRAVLALLKQYEPWLMTAKKGKNLKKVQKLSKAPILVLTGDSDIQKQTFYDAVPADGRLLLFGAVPRGTQNKADNYRRWSNNPWGIVEEGGQKKAGDWTKDDAKRLKQLVDQAHDNGLWIRFYTLNGISAPGLGESYNFGSKEAVEARWKACIEAGVDFVATDQYEEFAAFQKQHVAR